ncbi:MFS transporter [Shimwellia blattae]|uniref:Putative membrane protein n=1 Tax=Shimwellia blattae (strain ATCC 29907 / DSM 4481 / JCM 1650 / NBRC 105725 / CDC 9005-74) TaxID=630626 RepID=I2BDR6_SHIBC|nr:MFS transporter [Shimwellia blattae]AFJ48670.1 putative membrane protein [Shimwellia blattae DSM 4481 = NBRC 105725]GAB81295.1 purine ribonucleoside efflux pump NepI [Shimwellia blattae DSM 4481 = NBRC 105725]VDY66159.1 Purine ribonucleoside efflux pump nepI [Shimwellia blattae]VEC27152.1 Purine ribonucleoside efflux pump nepI [Shimwellia blattae]
MSEVVCETPHVKVSAHWGGVFAMTLAIFVLIASEFMPVSLLTPIARDLAITEGQAGRGIAISGAFAVLTSLLLPAIAGRLDRKYLLSGMTALMAISGVTIALAHSYPVYMVGRALIGIAIGGFWSISTATAMRLVPPHRVPRALAIFNSGNALATVVAPPLGSYLGTTVGWHGAFLCLVPVAVVALLWQGFSLPAMKAADSGKAQGGVYRRLCRPVVLLGLLACGGFYMGQFALFTYLRPFLEHVTRVSAGTLSLMLLITGMAGVVGTLVISPLFSRRLWPVLIAIPLVMAAIAGILMLAGHHAWVVAPLLAGWGMVSTAAPVGWWTWLARTLPGEAEAGGGLMVAVIQLSIAMGSTAGGMMFDQYGWQSAFGLSGVLLVCAAVLTFRLARRG